MLLTNQTSRNWLIVTTSLLLAGFVVVPVLAFIGGQTLAGPYEGRFGVFGYLGNIYADLWNGNWPAIALVGAPAAVVLAWFAAIRLRRTLMKPDSPS